MFSFISSVQNNKVFSLGRNPTSSVASRRRTTTPDRGTADVYGETLSRWWLFWGLIPCSFPDRRPSRTLVTLSPRVSSSYLLFTVVHVLRHHHRSRPLSYSSSSLPSSDDDG